MIFFQIFKNTSLLSVNLQNNTGGKKIFFSLILELIILKTSSSTFGTIKSKLYFLISDFKEIINFLLVPFSIFNFLDFGIL